jgi:DNA-binding NtrC family response regulator
MQEIATRPDVMDLEVLGREAPDVCILFTSRCPARDLARRIHDVGTGRQAPFLTIDCRGRNPRLEQQLTDALGSGTTGTVLLEHVGRLPPPMQDRLLSLLAEATRARVMAWTSEPLFPRTLEGSFNDRLFYRLNTLHLIVPDGGPGLP